MPTPHNSARMGDIAPTVIMSGDPLRAQFMAEHYLDHAKPFNSLRNMLGFTGTFHGKPVSVMGHGMGMPSIGIYTYELFHFYNVQRIVRAGTAGAIQQGLNIGDVVLAQGACTDSNYLSQFGLPGTYAPLGSFALLQQAAAYCEAHAANLHCHVGNVLSSDVFYDEAQTWKQWQRMGVLAVEMETAALYANAAKAGREALTVLTISDNLQTNEHASGEQRQTAFTQMMDVAFSLV